MSLCYLFTLLFVIRAADAEKPTRWVVAAVAACTLGMLAKEAMVTAPVVVALFDRTFLSENWRQLWRDRRWLYLGLGTSWLALLWLMLVSPHPNIVGFDLHIGPVDYLMNQALVITRYLRLAIWPDALLLDYGPARRLDVAEVALPGLCLTALLGASLFGYRRYPRVAFLGLWFFAILAPTSSFVPIVGEVGAERRMYLPLIAIVVGVVVFAHRVLDDAISRQKLTQKAANRVGSMAVIAVTVALAATTIARNQLYHDVVAIWRDTCEHAPLNPRAHNGLGFALSRAGDPNAAISAYREALALDDRYIDARYNLGHALSRIGKNTEAAEQYELVTSKYPDHYRAHNNLGNTYLQLGRADEAEIAFREVLRVQPASAFGANGLGLALLRQGRTDPAIVAFETALQSDPRYVHAALNLGATLEALDRSDEAVKAYEHVLRFAPQNDVARTRLAELRRNESR
jgi:Flp pilus assembly protein TadD